MMKEVYVYNVVCYDGVDAYVIKVIASSQEQVISQMLQYGDMEVLKVDKLHSWENLNEHIKGAIKGEYELADGDKQLVDAIYRYVEYTTGLDLR